MRTPAIALLVLFAIPCFAAEPLHKIKPLDTDNPLFPTASDYMTVLERFPLFAENGWHGNYQGHANVGYWGNAYSGEMGQRPQANFIVAYALMSRETSYDPTVSGVMRETLRSRALDGLRYMTRTHFSGDLVCTDKRPWGNAWQSAYWTARMALGAYLLWPHLSDSERADVRRVLAAEANLLPRSDRPLAGLLGNTRSEENAWDTEGLAWALKLCPDHPDRAKWRRVLDLLAMNTLTTEQDLSSEKVIAGTKVKDWVQGINVHPDFSIENHGYFHICYMTCPLHSFAWDWLCWSLPDISPNVDKSFDGYKTGAWPETLDFHTRDVWERTKQYYLYDGRFAYAGGKDWPRYAYGLYFVMPALVQYSQQHGDREARLIEGARVRQFDEEQRIHNDGSFYSGRFTFWELSGRRGEWETDTAGHLSVCYLLHQLKEPIRPATLEEFNKNHRLSHKSPSRHVMVRGDNRFASWSFKCAVGVMQGILIGRGSEDLAEWDHNLYGRVAVEGESDSWQLGEHTSNVFGGGFVATMVADEDVSSDYSLTVNDDDGWNHRIVAATHPIFTTPRRVESLAAARAYDTITASGPGWDILARDGNGNPSILEAHHGKGVFLICQMNAEEMVYSATPGARELWENLLTYLTNGKPSPRVALFGQEDHAERAMKTLGRPATRLRRLNDALEPGRFDVVILERSLNELTTEWADVLDYVQGGGKILKFLVQDRGWQPGRIANRDSVGVRHYTSVVALPDDASLVKLDRLVAARDIGAVRVDDLSWRVVNDIFNDNTRTFYAAPGNQTLTGVGGEARTLPIRSRWLNVDDLWGIVCLDDAQGFGLVDNAERQSGPAAWMNSILAETINTPARTYAGAHKAGETIAEYGALLAVDQSHDTTRELADKESTFRRVTLDNASLFAAEAEGRDGKAYLIVINWSDTNQTISLPDAWKNAGEATGQDGAAVDPMTTRVYRAK